MLKDLATLRRINQVKARVSFTVTTTDETLAAKLEPGAPSPARRLAAMAKLAEAGIETGVVMMPILPFIEDTPENIRSIVTEAVRHQAAYIIPSFGVTVREGQREHFYRQLDVHFPDVREQYERAFGTNYFCPARNAKQLEALFRDLCAVHGLRTQLSPWPPKEEADQPSLF